MKKQTRAFLFLVIALGAVVFGILRVINTMADHRSADAGKELSLELGDRNAKTAKGLELRLWRRENGDLTAVLENGSGGPLPVYPPVRHLTLLVALFDAQGKPYEPRINMIQPPTQTGDEPVPEAPHSKTWELDIRIDDLRREFENLEGAKYLVARYRYQPRSRTDRKTGQAVEAEVWSNPVRLNP